MYFEIKGYGVVILVHDFIIKILSSNLNYIVNVAMWLKFDKCSISMREV